MKLLFLIFLVVSASDVFPQSIPELLKKAYHLSEEKKYEEAIVIYNNVLKKDTSNYRAYMDRGSLYFNISEMQKAYDGYTKAIYIHRDSATAYHYRAILFYKMLYSDEAIQDNTRALELTNDDSLMMICFSNRGNAKQQKRDFQGAFEDYKIIFTGYK